MPFINLSQKKEDQLTPTPAQPVSSGGGGQPEPAENAGNGTDNHEESKNVPTSLPGQEVSVDDEGIKEIKGPPLPQDSSPQDLQANAGSNNNVASDEKKTENPAENSPGVTDLPPLPETNAAVPLTVEADNAAQKSPDALTGLPSVKDEFEQPGQVEESPGIESATESGIVGPTEMPTAAGADGQVIQESLPDEVSNTPSADLPEVAEPVPVDADSSAAAEIPAAGISLGKELGIEPEQTPSASSEETVIDPINPKTSTIDNYFDLVLDKNASDLHFTVGYPPFLRIDGTLQTVGSDPLVEEDAERIMLPILNEDQQKSLAENKEIDFSYEYKENARFRVNFYYERGNLAGALRYIPTQIKTIEDLKLPKILHDFLDIPHGLILVTGPTGSGKSTTIASMIQEINTKQKKHIITVEDPIEYVYPKAVALVDQREVQEDTHSWERALRSTLRQDPNVVVVGEMRDYETIAAAITVAETGHLVFSTLHTNTAVQTIDRIIDVFPAHQQAQIRSQLANVITAVISQRLIPVRSGGRRVVAEILIGTNAVRNAIREAKTYQIDNIIQTSYDVGMSTLERSLVVLIREGELSVEEAQKYTTKPDELLRLIKKA